MALRSGYRRAAIVSWPGSRNRLVRGSAGSSLEARAEGSDHRRYDPGYSAVKLQMTARQYYDIVVSGRIRDATLSMQISVGFEPRSLLANYINYPVCDNYSVLLVLASNKEVRGASR